MPAPLHVYFLRRDAYERIAAEILRSPNKETGGILVGCTFTTVEGQLLLVVAASGPGKRARRGLASFVPDVESHQRELEYWRSCYASLGVDYVGEWHSHPPGETELSDGDLQQVDEILSDDSYYLPYGIYTPLFTLEDGSYKLHSWYIPRDGAQPTLIEWSVIEGEPDFSHEY